jgi:TonB family protein
MRLGQEIQEVLRRVIQARSLLSEREEMGKKPRDFTALRFIAAQFLCACLLLPGLCAPRAAGQQKDAEKQYDAARKQFAEMEYQKALEGAGEALKIDPSFAPALFLRSQSLMELYARENYSVSKEAREARLKQLTEAAEITEEYLKQNPNLAYGDVWREQLKALQAYVRFAHPNRDPNSPNAVFQPKELPIKAKLLKRPEPGVTEEARRACAQGSVVLRGVIDRDGTVQSLVVVGSVGYGLTEESLKAARKARFSPAQKDGRAVPQYLQIEYNFSFSC